jgi:hypothetical protein
MLPTIVGRIAFASLLIASCAVVELEPAKAVTWNLSTPAGNPGNHENFTSGGYTIGAAGFGFTAINSSETWFTLDLYNKNGGGDENGLGINNDPTNDHEIYLNTLVRIDTTSTRGAGLNLFQFGMGSSTNGEGWDIYGSQSANTGLVALFTNGKDESLHTLANYNFYYFTYDGTGVQSGQGDNVLLHLFEGADPPGDTPIPAALPLFASGAGLLGFLNWRRKKRQSNIAKVAA